MEVKMTNYKMENLVKMTEGGILLLSFVYFIFSCKIITLFQSYSFLYIYNYIIHLSFKDIELLSLSYKDRENILHE